jgi:pyruvate formate lyase activating enzyme
MIATTKSLSPEEEILGLVFSIQKFSLHDGSGIRTLLFLKGCPLSCEWCANPEGRSYAPELAYNPDRCIGDAECDRCRPVCDAGAIVEGQEGKVAISREVCTNCGECAGACPSQALKLFGKHMTIGEVIRVVEEDSRFYARSGGGLTLSGGEPLSQPTFVEQLLKKARSRGIDTALETSGFCTWEDLERACRHVNQLLFDIKTLDARKHREGTGVGNEPILANLRRLAQTFPRISIVVRTPVIPRFNDTPEDIGAIVDFLNELPSSVAYELLPYHRFGEPKYDQLGKEYPLRGLEPPSREHMAALGELIPPDRSCLSR